MTPENPDQGQPPGSKSPGGSTTQQNPYKSPIQVDQTTSAPPEKPPPSTLGTVLSVSGFILAGLVLVVIIVFGLLVGFCAIQGN